MLSCWLRGGEQLAMRYVFGNFGDTFIIRRSQNRGLGCPQAVLVAVKISLASGLEAHYWPSKSFSCRLAAFSWVDFFIHCFSRDAKNMSHARQRRSRTREALGAAEDKNNGH